MYSIAKSYTVHNYYTSNCVYVYILCLNYGGFCILLWNNISYLDILNQKILNLNLYLYWNYILMIHSFIISLIFRKNQLSYTKKKIKKKFFKS
jgi:hypothetical protein